MEKLGIERSGKSSGSSFSSPTRLSKKETKKSSGSSRHARLVRKNVVRMKGIPKLTVEMRKRLKALDDHRDDQIDFSDIPEMTEDDWQKPRWIGLHYSPGKKSVTIRIDEDIVKWFKAQGKGWQTKMNWVLRLYFASHRKQGVKAGRP